METNKVIFGLALLCATATAVLTVDGAPANGASTNDAPTESLEQMMAPDTDLVEAVPSWFGRKKAMAAAEALLTVAYAGSCTNGALAAQASRTQDNHCGS